MYAPPDSRREILQRISGAVGARFQDSYFAGDVNADVSMPRSPAEIDDIATLRGLLDAAGAGVPNGL